MCKWPLRNFAGVRDSFRNYIQLTVMLGFYILEIDMAYPDSHSTKTFTGEE